MTPQFVSGLDLLIDILTVTFYNFIIKEYPNIYALSPKQLPLAISCMFFFFIFISLHVEDVVIM